MDCLLCIDADATVCVMFPASEGDVFGAARSGPRDDGARIEVFDTGLVGWVGSGRSRPQSAFCHGGVGWPLEGRGMVAGSGKGQGSGGVGGWCWVVCAVDGVGEAGGDMGANVRAACGGVSVSETWVGGPIPSGGACCGSGYRRGATLGSKDAVEGVVGVLLGQLDGWFVGHKVGACFNCRLEVWTFPFCYAFSEVLCRLELHGALILRMKEAIHNQEDVERRRIDFSC